MCHYRAVIHAGIVGEVQVAFKPGGNVNALQDRDPGMTNHFKLMKTFGSLQVMFDLKQQFGCVIELLGDFDVKVQIASCKKSKEKSKKMEAFFEKIRSNLEMRRP